jgi:hypothetical protein
MEWPSGLVKCTKLMRISQAAENKSLLPPISLLSSVRSSSGGCEPRFAFSGVFFDVRFLCYLQRCLDGGDSLMLNKCQTALLMS